MSFYAIVNGQPTVAAPKAVGVCPGCHTEMVAKCGDIMTWHWAHRPGSDCAYGNDGESGWHMWWKWQFHHAGGRVEVSYRSEHGRNHRADAVTVGGLVVEMQHDYLALVDIASREHTYGRMAWIYDGGRFADRLDHGVTVDGTIKFNWSGAAPSITKHQRPVLWHVGADVWIVDSLTMRPDGRGWNADGTARNLGSATDLAAHIDILDLEPPTILDDADGGAARARVMSMPRCPSCRMPMVVGQSGMHIVCAEGIADPCTCETDHPYRRQWIIDNVAPVLGDHVIPVLCGVHAS